jgi:hypothetical protein
MPLLMPPLRFNPALFGLKGKDNQITDYWDIVALSFAFRIDNSTDMGLCIRKIDPVMGLPSVVNRNVQLQRSASLLKTGVVFRFL